MSITMIAVALKRALDKLGAQGIKVIGEDAANCVLAIAVAAAHEGGMERERFDQLVASTWDDWTTMMGSQRFGSKRN